MARDNTVTLSSNGPYWQARYYDNRGHRRAKNLGPKSKLSKRKAKVLCNRLAAELYVNPGRADVGQASTLDEFLSRHMQIRTDLAEGTRRLHDMTRRYLLEFFGPKIRIDRISRATAAEWRDELALGRLTGAQTRKYRKLKSEATVCGHIRIARSMFSRAVRDDQIMFNPFGRLKGTAPEPRKDWRYVTLQEFERLLSVCPNISWQCFLGLQRLAGLRRGEALAVRWPDIDWDTHRLEVYAQKTKKTRFVPIEPRLYKLLLDAFDTKHTFVCIQVLC